MSQKTGIIFRQALKSNANFVNILAAKDIYSTAIPLPDDGIDNVPLPYAIVMVLAAQNDESTKDTFEGQYDSRTIAIEIAAKTTDEVADLAEQARDTIMEYFEEADEETDNYDLIPEDYHYSDDGIAFDSLKPCFFTNLTYQCDVHRSSKTTRL